MAQLPKSLSGGLRGTSRCHGGGFAKEVARNVKNGEASSEGDLQRAREILAPTGIDYVHAWSAALDLCDRFAWVIAAVARQLAARRVLDAEQFLKLVRRR